MAATIWWARRDLRLNDNFALQAALAAGEAVIPVFVLDPRLLAWRDAGPKRVAFMLAALRSLDAELRARGSRLTARIGDPEEELARLREETGAAGVWAEADPWPYARERDARVGQRVPLTLTPGITAHPYDAILKPDGGAYTVYTPFSRAWKAFGMPKPTHSIPAPERLAPPPDIESLPIPDEPVLPGSVPFLASEEEGLRRLRAFAGGADAPIYRYGETRNRMDLDGTAQLSPYLRWGLVSPLRAAVAAVHAMENAPSAGARKGAETWLNELIWREFYQATLFRFPYVLEQEFQERMRGIQFRSDPDELAAWQEGRTGYPVVDAAMRQLVTTGWMHNRARLIVASFLVKDLLIDWRLGERFFMQHLLDGDPAANNGGWQWTAGVGTDAAPYFRVFNPAVQAEKFDPDGAYVRRWVPELTSVPQKYIQTPHLMPRDEQERIRITIGQDYPQPIVDHATARERVLAAFKVR
jgi:deoxyribodipyrimidine photo-lyase